MQKLSAQSRDITGKKVKQLRNQSFVPASIYGPTRDPINVKIDKKTFKNVFKHSGYSRLIEMDVEGEKSKFRAVIKEVQSNVITQEPIHVSFYQVDPKKKLTAEVPVELKGVAPAVKNNLGFLATPLDEIVVRCLPDDLPPFIEVDISGLSEVGASITIADVNLPEGVEVDSNMQETTAVAYIAVPQKRVDVDAEGDESEDGESEDSESSEDGESEDSDQE